MKFNFSPSSVLLVILITLKAVGFCTWPWLWVLAPLWIPLSAVLVVLVVAVIISLFVNEDY